MAERLKGKRALIYGGGTGIGFGCAEAMAREGAHVFLSGRREAKLREAAEMLGAIGPVGHAPGDASLEADVARVTAAAVEAMGGLDCIVISAGNTRIASIFDETLDGFREIIDANMVSTFLASRAAVPHLQAAGGGAIIAISSVLGLVGLRQRVAYCASKAGILGMVRAMALDLASHGIRVNAICPGNVETELVREIVGREPDPEAVMAARRRASPIQRSGETREIAAAAVYFASDDAAWTTGQYLTVDGGFTIR
jgi:NAD(P)-dependent dehydrogenase (short-subunit alcohol dehydrogenase family)